MLDSDRVNLILYSALLVFGARGRGLSLLSPSRRQKFKHGIKLFKHGIKFHSQTRRESRRK